MRNLAVLTLLALSFGCDGATEPAPPTTQRVTLHFVGVALSDAGPVEGAVVEYTVYPCRFLGECDLRLVSADTTDGQGRYSIAAERTCASDEPLSLATDSVRSDVLRAYFQLDSTSICGSSRSEAGTGSIYGPSDFLCTSEPQVFDFDFGSLCRD